MLYRVVFIFSFIVSVVALPTQRIVGGHDAEVGQFPYQISLLRNGTGHFCGGSILNERYILTAAHCVVVKGTKEVNPVEMFQVRVGSIIRNDCGEVYELKSITINPNYGDFLNDVALLQTVKSINFTKNIAPIELAQNEVPSQADVVIAGFGRTSTGGPIPVVLKWNTLKALNSTECQERTNKWGCDNILCLSHDPDNGACNGDSGGPAVYNNTLVGVAGFVIGGCGSTYPDGYAKVFYHRHWIEENMTL